MEQHNPALLTVTGEEAGGKLIRFLERRLEGNFPPAMFHKWIRTGQVRVNGKRAKPFLPLGAGDQVRLPPFALPRVFTGAEGLLRAPVEESPLAGGTAQGSASCRASLPFFATCAPVAAPFLWMHGLAKLGPSRATTLMNLLPVFTVIIAMLFLGETLHSYDVIGGGVTLLGVLMVQTLKRPLRRAQA